MNTKTKAVLVGAAAIIVALQLGILDGEKAPQEADKVSNISFNETLNAYPSVTFEFHGDEDSATNIESIDFILSDVFIPKEFRNVNFDMQPAIWEYDIKFGQEPSTIVHNVSKRIPKNDSELFSFVLAQDLSPAQLPMLARFRVKITYNTENNAAAREVLSEDLIVLIPRAVDIKASYNAGFTESDRLWNVAHIKAFSMLTGKRSPQAEEQFKIIEQVLLEDELSPLTP